MNSPQASNEIQLADSHAIELASKTSANFLLIDDAAARTFAKAAGLNVMGTIGLLEQAAFDQLIDLAGTVAVLQKTNFFASPDLFREALERHDFRTKQKPHP